MHMLHVASVLHIVAEDAHQCKGYMTKSVISNGAAISIPSAIFSTAIVSREDLFTNGYLLNILGQ